MSHDSFVRVYMTHSGNEWTQYSQWNCTCFSCIHRNTLTILQQQDLILDSIPPLIKYKYLLWINYLYQDDKDKQLVHTKQAIWNEIKYGHSLIKHSQVYTKPLLMIARIVIKYESYQVENPNPTLNQDKIIEKDLKNQLCAL